MGFQSGLSGLNAAAKNLDVIGNNVANSNTIGFKSSRAIFADVFAGSMVGGGAKLAAVQQEFGQGNITVTNNALDLAINGGGFFRFDNNGTPAYSRNGQLHLDSSGYLVNADGLRLLGYGVDAANNIVASSPMPLRLSSSDVAPRSTSEMEANVNLDSRATTAPGPFSPTVPTSYTSSASSVVYDSLGNSHSLTLYFAKTAVAGQWNVHATVDGGPVANVNLGAGAGNPVTINFSNTGVLTTAMPFAGVQLTLSSGAVTPLVTSLDFTGSTQFGSDFGVNALTQNGYSSGRLTGFDIAEDGVVQGRYSNGQSNTLGQVVLANFANPHGLRSVGDNMWAETASSGLPVLGAPQTGSLGAIGAGKLEDSNVDLTQELVNMITAQRVYQANAQTIKTVDQTIQTLVNLR